MYLSRLHLQNWRTYADATFCCHVDFFKFAKQCGLANARPAGNNEKIVVVNSFNASHYQLFICTVLIEDNGYALASKWLSNRENFWQGLQWEVATFNLSPY